MSRPGVSHSSLVLGAMWGFAGGMSVAFSVVYLEVRARAYRRPPVKPVAVTLPGNPRSLH